jgi:hypothetical protein
MFHCTWPRYSDSERTLVADRLKAAGITWVRIDVSWSQIENTGKGARNASYLQRVDGCVDLARNRGLSVLLQLWQTPGWANGGKGVIDPPTNPSDFGDFAQWIAARYRGRAAAWEVWNEENNGTFWSGSVAQYTSLLKAAYQGFKAGDSAAQVVLGGLMYNDDGYLDQIYANGGKGSFDVVATHPYQGIGDMAPEAADGGSRAYYTHTPAVRQVMANHGDNKPIWFTEYGWSAHDNAGIPYSWALGVSEAVQADYAVRGVKYAAANWPYVGAIFWYKERSWDLPSSDPEWFSRHLEGYGLLRADDSQRPVYSALRSYLTGG